MNLYNAILKAADHIEHYPDDFNYHMLGVPACGSPGCAVGWIAHFSGVKAQPIGVTGEVCKQVLGVDYWGSFVGRMDRAVTGYWRRDPFVCAAALRLYAEKYHGHEKPPALHPGFVKLRGDLNELQAGVMLEQAL